MSLGEKVNNLLKKAKQHIFVPESKEKMKGYLLDNHLNSYFEGASDHQKERYMNLLEDNIDRSFEKYRKSIDSTVSRWGTKIGIGIGLSEVLDIAIEAPTLHTVVGTYGLIAAKTAFELPKVYDYLKKTKDINGVYGMAKYGLRKMMGMYIPFVGPAIEGGALKSMLKKRILYEAKKGFLKDIGEYKSLYSRIMDRVEDVAGAVRDRLAPEPALQRI